MHSGIRLEDVTYIHDDRLPFSSEQLMEWLKKNIDGTFSKEGWESIDPDPSNPISCIPGHGFFGVEKLAGHTGFCVEAPSEFGKGQKEKETRYENDFILFATINTNLGMARAYLRYDRVEGIMLTTDEELEYARTWRDRIPKCFGGAKK